MRQKTIFAYHQSPGHGKQNQLVTAAQARSQGPSGSEAEKACNTDGSGYYLPFGRY
jgi:hypothetical protein